MGTYRKMISIVVALRYAADLRHRADPNDTLGGYIGRANFCIPVICRRSGGGVISHQVVSSTLYFVLSRTERHSVVNQVLSPRLEKCVLGLGQRRRLGTKVAYCTYVLIQ